MPYRIRLETLCGCTQEWEQPSRPTRSFIKRVFTNSLRPLGMMDFEKMPQSVPFAERLFKFYAVQDGVWRFIEWDPKLEPEYESN
jgi:hypothetical protein